MYGKREKIIKSKNITKYRKMILIKVYGDFGSEYKWLIKNGLQKSQKVN